MPVSGRRRLEGGSKFSRFRIPLHFPHRCNSDVPERIFSPHSLQFYFNSRIKFTYLAILAFLAILKFDGGSSAFKLAASLLIVYLFIHIRRQVIWIRVEIRDIATCCWHKRNHLLFELSWDFPMIQPCSVYLERKWRLRSIHHFRSEGFLINFYLRTSNKDSSVPLRFDF